MFGIGFTEFLLIFVIAILFLGPDKLPQALVDMAKFIKGVKRTIGEAKNSIEEEMKIADLKEEALHYKQQLDEATHELRNFKNIDFDDLDTASHNKRLQSPIEEEEKVVATQVEERNETVTFKKPTPQKENSQIDKKGDA